MKIGTDNATLEVLTRIARAAERIARRGDPAPRADGWPASSDPYYVLIYDLAHAWLNGYTNELALDQKADEHGVPTMDDPVKLRFGVWKPADGRPGYYISTISFDVLSVEDGAIRRLEIGFLGFKLDPYPCLECYLLSDATGDDEHQELLFRWSLQDGFEFWSIDDAGDKQPLLLLKRSGADFRVPVIGGSTPPPTPDPAPPQAALAYLDDTVHQAHLQADDGNFVGYMKNADGTLGAPLWDMISTIDRVADLERRVKKLERS